MVSCCGSFYGLMQYRTPSGGCWFTLWVMAKLHIPASRVCSLNENPSQFLITHLTSHSILDRTYQNTLDVRHCVIEKLNLNDISNLIVDNNSSYRSIPFKHNFCYSTHAVPVQISEYPKWLPHFFPSNHRLQIFCIRNMFHLVASSGWLDTLKQMIIFC